MVVLGPFSDGRFRPFLLPALPPPVVVLEGWPSEQAPAYLSNHQRTLSANHAIGTSRLHAHFRQILSSKACYYIIAMRVGDALTQRLSSDSTIENVPGAP